MSNYDKYYNENKQYFGEPHKVLIEFFSSSKSKGSVVDLGAGQGRNSIPLNNMGYDVTAVDISQVGLDQITGICPEIKTRCHDIYTFDISPYDYILMDSMLHFYKRDIKKETALVQSILSSMKQGSVFINCMIQSHHNIFMNLIDTSKEIEIIQNTNFLYQKQTKYIMAIIKKT